MKHLSYSIFLILAASTAQADALWYSVGTTIEGIPIVTRNTNIIELATSNTEGFGEYDGEQGLKISTINEFYIEMAKVTIGNAGSEAIIVNAN